ncbi:MAG: hypothetical protein ACK553_14135 [Planctomycetota bacterium]|jgi:hypothetical protein
MPDCTLSVYSGNEPFFSFFSSAEVALATLRLTLAERCLFQASDLASQMATLRREFQHNGKFPEALQDVMRIANQFQARVQNWEREVQNLERSKREMTGTRLQRIRVEVSQVRVKIQMTERVLAKLQIVIHQLQAEESERHVAESKAAMPVAIESIDDEEADSVLAQFQEAVEAFIGQGLVLESGEADFDSLRSGLGVQFWEQPIFFAFAHWPIDESNDRGVNRRLVFWLIPKFKDIARNAAGIARSLRLQVAGSGSHEFIEFQAVCPLANIHPTDPSAQGEACVDLPQSPSVRQALDRLIAKRFDQDGSKLMALRAEIPRELAKDGRVILEMPGPRASGYEHTDAVMDD